MISVKKSFNIDTPFIYLARKLLRDPNLEFVVPPPTRALENQLLVKENRPLLDPALETLRKDLEMREKNLMALESRRRLKTQRVLRQKVSCVHYCGKQNREVIVFGREYSGSGEVSTKLLTFTSKVCMKHQDFKMIEYT